MVVILSSLNLRKEKLMLIGNMKWCRGQWKERKSRGSDLGFRYELLDKDRFLY